MDSSAAFARGEAARLAGSRSRVFDWDRAAQIIADDGITHASAGLSQDWEWTGGDILRDGLPVHDGGTFLASTWAIPELDTSMDGPVPCWRWKDETEWDASTVWPDSALSILAGVPKEAA